MISNGPDEVISNGPDLDALEKLLDYADADVINDEDDDIEPTASLIKQENKNDEPEETTGIFTMDEDCKLDEEEEDEEERDNKAATKAVSSSSNSATIADNAQETNATNHLLLTNGTTKDNHSKSPLSPKKSNGLIKSKSASTSASSSTSSLASQSPEAKHSLAVAKLGSGANKLQMKTNGFTLQNGATISSSAPTDKEHLLSTSLKSNSSSIISSALAGHFQSCRQPWHGSRSSVSAVENAIYPSGSGTVTSHPSLHLRHSFSTASNYRLRECNDTLSSVLRNSVNTCSKDTLIFLDQQQHHNNHHHHHHHNHHRHHHSLMEDDDDSSFMGSRSLWVSLRCRIPRDFLKYANIQWNTKCNT